MFKDLRDFIELLDKKGELKYIEEADWNLELGTITELAATKIVGKPALLFDKVIHHPWYIRAFTGPAGIGHRALFPFPWGTGPQAVVQVGHRIVMTPSLVIILGKPVTGP